MGTNQEVTPQEIKAIRAITDFDIVMLISEIHEFGWPDARELLRMMPVATDILSHDAEGL